MGSLQRFNLRWDGFEDNIKVALREVRDENEFSDVTLVAGDGNQVKANKVILAGGSSFFFNILRENPHPHPLIYLRGVSHDQLLSLLDFLYAGEASIVQEDLKEFMDIAEDLKVKGLTPTRSQTESNPSTSAPLQSQGADEEPGPSPRVSYPHSSVFTTPASFQNQSAAKEPVTSHPHDNTSAHVQSQLTAEQSATTPKDKTSRPLNAISALQGEVVTEEHVPSLKTSRPPSMTTSNRDNAFPQATCKANHVNTDNVKVEVGDAEHYNVSYGMNQHGEPFRNHVSIRGLRDSEENIGCKGNISNVEVLGGKQREESHSEAMWLSEKQDKNDHVFSTGKKLKEEIIDCSTDVVISEAVDNEQWNYDWYGRGEENNRMTSAELEEDDSSEMGAKNNSLVKQEIVESNDDMDAREAADNIFINEQSNHACDERSEENFDDMMSDGAQDINRKKCSICAKTFPSLYKLKRHKIIHTGEKPFQCLVCFKRFSRMDTLKYHEGLHTGEKPYLCLQCSKKFSCPSELKTHQKIHSVEKQPFQCLTCFKKFSKAFHLKQHNRVHTGEQPFQCAMCFKKFSQAGNLKQHKRVHTGEQPYQCAICFKKFSDQSSFSRHKRMNHTNEKQFECSVCFEKFSRLDTLNLHKVIHTG